MLKFHIDFNLRGLKDGRLFEGGRLSDISVSRVGAHSRVCANLRGGAYSKHYGT